MNKIRLSAIYLPAPLLIKEGITTAKRSLDFARDDTPRFMPKSKQQKQAMLDSVKNKVANSTSAVFCVFNKLTVNDDHHLRAESKKNDVSYEVAKKTLLQKSLAESQISDAEIENARGNIGVAASSDEVASAKLIYNFAKDKEDFKILGGILNKQWVSAALIMELAKLPGKDELIAKVIGSVKAPVSGLVNVMAGNLRGLVNTLNAIKNNK
jgi:large subunit ribosomal protein L10